MTFELTFVGGTKRRYKREHRTYESAEHEARRVLTMINRATHPAIVYGPGCGRDGRTIA